MSDKKRICVLGSTGSIGESTLDVISQHPSAFEAHVLTAFNNIDKLESQCLNFNPKYAVMVDGDSALDLQSRLANANCSTEVLSGENSLTEVASLDEVDYVMAAIVGAAGLLPTLAAAKASKRVMLANKEALVMSGQLFIDVVRENSAELLPIDSEHNAIFQSLPLPVDGAQNKNGVLKILLTGSGGPFRQRDISTFQEITPEEAIAHPNWDMGQKISVDSATMMNKGLEVIEACWLFDVPDDQIKVVIHPQSTIHSMVSYNDGSVLAQLGNPDMRTPIAFALGYPQRITSGVRELDFFELAELNFEKPDFNRYPCLRLSYEAHQTGGFASIALNAANEVAVQSFLKRRIKFTDIPSIIENALEQAPAGTADNIDDILAQDLISRRISNEYIAAF